MLQEWVGSNITITYVMVLGEIAKREKRKRFGF